MLTGALETPRAAKVGRPHGVRCRRNWLAVWVCKGQQGPGEYVEGGKTAGTVRVVEASGGQWEWTLVWAGGPRPK